MKKQIYLFLLAIYSGIAFGQSIVEPNKVWNVIQFVNFGASTTDSYKFEGDSIIGNTTYNILWRTDDSTYSTWYFQSLFREDSDGKVFRYTPDGEELFYDFGLNVGDLFHGVIDGCEVDMTVDSIDNITLENGESRKRLILDYGTYYQEEWIAGIGSLFGLINIACEQCGIDVWYELNCFTENDTLKYDNPNYEPCYYTTVGIAETKSEQKFEVTPNPFIDHIKISFNYNENTGYEIWLSNAQGIVLKKYDNINSGTLNIPGEDLSKGIYFIQLFENGQFRSSVKLIKK